MITIAFQILTLNIDFTRYRDSGIPDIDGLYKAWKYLIDYFIRTPTRLSNGERYRKSSGVASGSYFTQIIDSVVNWIVTVYALKKCGCVPEDIIVLGDDSLVRLNKSVDLNMFAKYVELLGMIVNVEKTQVETNLSNVKFLGYKISNGIPNKPEHEFWASLRYPEYPDKSFDEYATRASGLLLATFGVHEEFYDIISNQLQMGFTPTMSPSLRRYCNALGIDEIPRKPPPIWRLQFPAFRNRAIRPPRQPD